MPGYKNTLIFGFILFAMFFGSGNLVFPLQIGQLAGNSWFYGFLGLLVTGIFLPFLGLFVIKLYKGNYIEFFGEAGRIAKIILPLFILSLLGSFGIVPRCITVAYGGFTYLFPQISLLIFSVIFCILTFLLCLKDKVMISVLGKALSPIKLVAMIILIFMGMLYAPQATHGITPQESLWTGFVTGYQTMDLFAAFFFSSLIFKKMQYLIHQSSISNNISDRDMILFALRPSLIGACLLAIIYLGLVYLGAHYAFLLKGVAPELLLPTISMHIMGASATFFVAFTMLFSCLATAVALNNIYASYIHNLLHLEPNKFPLVLFFTSLIAFIISLFDFTGIAAFLSPALEYSYPGIIALTMLCILTRRHKKIKIITFWVIVFSTIMIKI